MGADEFAIDNKLPLNDALFGFGDAVCVPAVEWIAKHYLNPLTEEYFQHTQATEEYAASYV